MTQPLTRDLVYRILADETGLNKGARAAERQLATIERRGRMVDAAMTRVSQGMIVVGAAIAGGLVLATRAAIDWESAWAGVAKTVDGTEPQMARLEADLRGLTRELPQSHREIAAVAEAAGQLGIKVGDVSAFTRTMIDLGEATNLTSDEAAFSIARMANIMGTLEREGTTGINRLGSALVDLGNNSATTEKDITEMALRIAGSGRVIGMSEANVLGFAAALSSVGIAAESGGTAFSKTMIKIEQSVRGGGEELDAFAKVAGLSAADFSKAYQQDAAGAINTFIQGLGRIQKSGGDLFATLDKLGLGEIRTRDALLRLAGAGDLVTRSLEVGNRGWEENSALLEEAERRYGTTEARMRIARNQLNDFAIDIGQAFVPVVGAMADALTTVGSIAGDLPGPLKVVLGILAALTATILLAGGAALIAVPRIAAFRQALDTLVASGGRAATAVGLFRSATSGVAGFLGGPWGLVLAASTVALGLWANEHAKSKRKVEELAGALDQQTGAMTENARVVVAAALAQKEFTFNAGTGDGTVLKFVDAMKQLNIAMETAVDAAAGNQSALRELELRLAEAEVAYGNATDITGRFADGTDEARQASIDNWTALNLVIEAVTEEGTEVQKAADKVRFFAEATGAATDETAQLEPQVRQMADGLSLTADEASNLSDELDTLDKELQALFDSVFALQNAEDALADALADLTEKAKAQHEANVEGAGSLKGQTEAARENRKAAQDLLEKYADLTLETLRATDSQEDAEEVAKDFEAALDELEEQTGLNVRKLEGYNDVVDEIERLVRVKFEARGMTEAEKEARNLAVSLDRIPRRINIDINQSVTAPVGGQKVGHQHGGEVLGPPGPDRVLGRALTSGEIVIRRDVAQPNRAALLAFNRTGRLPVGAGLPGGGSGSSMSYAVTTNVYPQRLDFGPRELETVQQAQEARLRVGRPR